MIKTRRQYLEFLNRDAVANWRRSSRPKFFGDYGWKFICALRKKEYYENADVTLIGKFFLYPAIVINKVLFIRYSVKCGYTIPTNVCDKGLSLPHRGNIVINTTAKIGRNCRIHEGVTIGSTGGSRQAAVIGNNVFIGSGAKIIGDISIADDVAIGASAVVVKSITEAGTTWAGNPAKKISNKNSHSNLAPDLLGSLEVYNE